VRLLLDTHVLVWWIGREQLKPAAVSAIADANTDVLVSAATVWEAEIKRAAGKLDLRVELAEQALVNRFSELPISFDHASAAARLPPHHSDPFDRMLVAQARTEGLTLVTRDQHLKAYDVPLLAA